MIIGESIKDIFDSDAQTLVVPVNTVGVMGRGLALDFAKRIPGLLLAYRNACFKGRLTTKRPWVYKLSDGRNVLCFASKEHWRNPSELEYIKDGLAYIRDNWKEMGIESLAMPAIGCGLGGLDYEGDVAPLLYEYLDPLPFLTVLHVPTAISGK